MNINFTEEKKSNLDHVVCHLRKNERIDTFVLGVMQNNEIDGALTFTTLTLDDNFIINYDITNKVPLNVFLEREINREQLLDAFISMLNLVITLDEFDINSNFIVFDFERVYVNQEKNEFEFICLPLEINQGGNAEVSRFLKEALLKANFAPNDDMEYVAVIMTALNPQKNNSFNQLLRLFKELKEAREVEKEDLPIYEIKEELPAKVSEPVDPYFVQKKPIKATSKIADERVSQTKKGSKIKPIFANEQQKWNQTLINFFTGKNDSQKSNNSFDRLMQKKKTKTSPKYKEKSPKTISDASAQTTVLKMSDINIKKSLLIREKTYEQLVLNDYRARSYTIGSEEESVDYAVSDNTAVSRKHAVFTFEDEGFFVTDNYTTNGTFLNEERVQYKVGPLKHKDRITLGNEVFEYHEI